MSETMTDEKSPAPAVIPNAPAVDTPSLKPDTGGVDLSDLQAELDAESAKAAEERRNIWSGLSTMY